MTNRATLGCLSTPSASCNLDVPDKTGTVRVGIRKLLSAGWIQNVARDNLRLPWKVLADESLRRLSIGDDDIEMGPALAVRANSGRVKWRNA